MPRPRARALVAAALVAVAGSGVAAVPSFAASEYLYVANTTDPVTVYDAGSSGAVQPTAVIANPNLTGTFWDPWTVTLDGSSNVFLQSYLSNATTFVFPPGSSGPPSRVFEVTGPDSEGIAVDAQGYEYVMGGESTPQISVAAPGAAGTAGGSYSVTPVRQFSTDQDGFEPWPSTIAVDGQGDLVVAEVKASGNEIEVFQGGPSGSSTPLRTIVGVDTGLGTCTGFSTCDHLSVTYSSQTGDIYAAVSTASGTHISVFSGTASGDAVPLRSISGASTGLAGNVITGIAVSSLSGDLYSMVKTSQFAGPGQVEVFGTTAAGNAQPQRTFTDSNSSMVNAQGIAIGITSPPAQAPEVGVAVLLPLMTGIVLASAVVVRRRRSGRREG